MAPRDIVRRSIDRADPTLPLARQAELLGIARSTIYYEPVPVSAEELTVMAAIDRLYTAHPFYGERRISKQLRREGVVVNHKRVGRLMQDMGIQGLIPKPNLSKNSLAHPVYPYLLNGLPIVRPNQVWGTDITYIKMKYGFLYLVAFLDWFSRYVLSWRLSTTMTTEFCLEAAREAIDRYGLPDIENSDQGVQFTSPDYLALWDTNHVRISMDGRGRALDNIFTERLWRSVKYEEVYLHQYETVAEATRGIGNYLAFYNTERLHQSLQYQTPAEIYFGHRN